MDTIIQDERECWICHRKEPLHLHHCLEGSYRNNATKLGLTIFLCPDCHRKVHENERKMQYFRKLAQVKAMEFYGWSVDDFIRKVGRNFI